ncbi:MAG: PAS domain S-box protein [Leptolyngbyaceae cyanobacterium bins.349]|nr:PAS domain S-box protein [Leptolyngbyaceae cyanobacterium bins.349]
MKRDTAGKFTRNWDSETKQRVSITLTATAWQRLDEAAQQQGTSRSEIIENFARSLGDRPSPSTDEACHSSMNAAIAQAPIDTSPEPDPTCTEFTRQQVDQKVATILESISDAFVAFDRDWRYTYVNQAATRILERTRAELIGKHVWNEIYPDLVGKLPYQELQRAVAEQISVAWEEWSEPLQRWLEVSAYPSAEGVAVYFRDISYRKQLEAAQQQIEAQMRLASEAAQIGMWHWDVASDTLIWTDQAKRLFGLPLDQAMTMQVFMKAVHPADRPLIQATITQLQQAQAIQEIEYRTRWPDGTIRWISARGNGVYDASGQLIATRGVLIDITDRKQAIADLERSEARFRRLVEASMFGVAIGDFSGRMVYANDALLTMIGYSRAELEAGHINWLALTPPEQVHLDLKAGEELRQRGVATPFEKEYIHKDGHRVPILLGGALLAEPFSEQQHIIGFYLDLTELKRTESALREQQLLLETILKQAADGIIVCDASGKLTFVNRTARRLAQQDPEGVSLDFGLESWGTAYNPDGDLIPLEEYAVTRALRGEVCSAVESRMVYADGSYYDILVSAAPLRNHQQQIIGAVGTFVDISDRKRAEKALRQSEERLRVALVNSPITVFNQDRELRYTWIYNPALNYQSDELIGKQDHECFPTPDAEVLTQVKRRVLATGQGLREEVKLAPQGKDYYYDLTVEPLRHPNGEIVGITCAAIDITPQKQLLQREQAAREAAETANRIKDEFLAVLSHELRSPLNPILGWARLLQTRPFEPEQAKHALATIERNAKLQTQLIEDLLDVSRILQGKVNLKIGPVNLVTVVEAALETVRLAAQAKGIELQFTVSNPAVLDPAVLDPAVPDHPQSPATTHPPIWISGDAARLQQIVWNLLSNAVKFTLTGGQVNVRLETHPATPTLPHAPSYAQITVTDTGKGISPDFLPYVFDYFRQEDGSTTRRFGGLGLGLAIVRYLTELHGGTVQAESLGEGKGARFTVQLPLLNPSTQVVEVATQSPPRANLSHLRILVVDDEPDMRDLIQTILETQGATVTIATSAIEALQLFDQQLPDILISDVGMPEMDGFQLIQQIRQRSPDQGGKVLAIALTAYAREPDQQRALAAGFQTHLAKPIDPEALVSAIAALCQETITPAN